MAIAGRRQRRDGCFCCREDQLQLQGTFHSNFRPSDYFRYSLSILLLLISISLVSSTITSYGSLVMSRGFSDTTPDCCQLFAGTGLTIASPGVASSFSIFCRTAGWTAYIQTYSSTYTLKGTYSYSCGTSGSQTIPFPTSSRWAVNSGDFAAVCWPSSSVVPFDDDFTSTSHVSQYCGAITTTINANVAGTLASYDRFYSFQLNVQSPVAFASLATQIPARLFPGTSVSVSITPPDSPVSDTRIDLSCSGGATITPANGILTFSANSLSSVSFTVATPSIGSLSSGSGLIGRYYSDSNLGMFVFARVDSTVDWNYGLGSPDASLTNVDAFSMRWTGYITATTSETYSLCTSADDGTRLWVDGTLLVDRWVQGSETLLCGSFAMIAAQPYALLLEYMESGGSAAVHLEWSSPSIATQVIPASALSYDALPIVCSFSFDASTPTASAQFTLPPTFLIDVPGPSIIDIPNLPTDLAVGQSVTLHLTPHLSIQSFFMAIYYGIVQLSISSTPSLNAGSFLPSVPQSEVGASSKVIPFVYTADSSYTGTINFNVGLIGNQSAYYRLTTTSAAFSINFHPKSTISLPSMAPSLAINEYTPAMAIALSTGPYVYGGIDLTLTCTGVTLPTFYFVSGTFYTAAAFPVTFHWDQLDGSTKYFSLLMPATLTSFGCSFALQSSNASASQYAPLVGNSFSINVVGTSSFSFATLPPHLAIGESSGEILVWPIAAPFLAGVTIDIGLSAAFGSVTNSTLTFPPGNTSPQRFSYTADSAYIGSLQLTFTLGGEDAAHYAAISSFTVQLHPTANLNIVKGQIPTQLAVGENSGWIGIKPSQVTFLNGMTLSLSCVSSPTPSAVPSLNQLPLIWGGGSVKTKNFTITAPSAVGTLSCSWSLSGSDAVHYNLLSPSSFLITVAPTASIAITPASIFPPSQLAVSQTTTPITLQPLSPAFLYGFNLSFICNNGATLAYASNSSDSALLSPVPISSGLLFTWNTGESHQQFFAITTPPTTPLTVSCTFSLSGSDAVHYFLPSPFVINAMPRSGFSVVGSPADLALDEVSLGIVISPQVAPYLNGVYVTIIEANPYGGRFSAIGGQLFFPHASMVSQTFTYRAGSSHLGVVQLKFLISGPDYQHYTTPQDLTINIYPRANFNISWIPPALAINESSGIITVEPSFRAFLSGFSANLDCGVGTTVTNMPLVWAAGSASVQSFEIIAPLAPTTVSCSWSVSGSDAVHYVLTAAQQTFSIAVSPTSSFIVGNYPSQLALSEFSGWISLTPKQAPFKHGVSVAISASIGSIINPMLVFNPFAVPYSNTLDFAFVADSNFIGNATISFVIIGDDLAHYFPLPSITIEVVLTSAFELLSLLPPDLAISESSKPLFIRPRNQTFLTGVNLLISCVSSTGFPVNITNPLLQWAQTDVSPKVFFVQAPPMRPAQLNCSFNVSSTDAVHYLSPPPFTVLPGFNLPDESSFLPMVRIVPISEDPCVNYNPCLNGGICSFAYQTLYNATNGDPYVPMYDVSVPTTTPVAKQMSCACPKRSFGEHCQSLILGCIDCSSTWTGGAYMRVVGTGLGHVEHLSILGLDVPFRVLPAALNRSDPILTGLIDANENAGWSDQTKAISYADVIEFFSPDIVSTLNATNRLVFKSSFVTSSAQSGHSSFAYQEFTSAVPYADISSRIEPSVAESARFAIGGRSLLASSSTTDPYQSLLSSLSPQYLPLTFSVAFTGIRPDLVRLARMTVNYTQMLYYSSNPCTNSSQWSWDPVTGTCAACPDGCNCPGGGRCRPLPGYWSSSELYPAVKCKLSQACPGSADALMNAALVGGDPSVPTLDPSLYFTTQRCSDGYDPMSSACSKCADGYMAFDGVCVACSSGNDSSQTAQDVLVILVFISFLVLLSIAVAACDPSQLAMIITVWVILQESIEVGAKGAANMPFWSTELTQLFGYASMINFNLQVVRPGCGSLPALSFLAIFWIQIGMAIGMGCVFVLACYIRLRIRLKAEAKAAAAKVARHANMNPEQIADEEAAETKKREDDLAKRREEWVTMSDYKRQQSVEVVIDPWLDFRMRVRHSLLILCSLFYLNLNTLFLEAWRCEEGEDAPSNDLDASLQPPTTHIYLNADSTMRCYTPGHIFTLICTIFFFAIYTLYIPLWLWVTLVRDQGTPHSVELLTAIMWDLLPKVFRPDRFQEGYVHKIESHHGKADDHHHHHDEPHKDHPIEASGKNSHPSSKNKPAEQVASEVEMVQQLPIKVKQKKMRLKKKSIPINKPNESIAQSTPTEIQIEGAASKYLSISPTVELNSPSMYGPSSSPSNGENIVAQRDSNLAAPVNQGAFSKTFDDTLMPNRPLQVGESDCPVPSADQDEWETDSEAEFDEGEFDEDDTEGEPSSTDIVPPTKNISHHEEDEEEHGHDEHDEGGPTGPDDVIHYHRMSQYGFLFIGLKAHEFTDRMENFWAGVWFSAVGVYVDDNNLSLFLYGLFFSYSLFMNFWQWSYIRDVDNTRSAVCLTGSLVHAILMLGLQESGTSTPGFIVLVLLLCFIFTAIVMRNWLIGIIGRCFSSVAEKIKREREEADRATRAAAGQIVDRAEIERRRRAEEMRIRKLAEEEAARAAAIIAAEKARIKAEELARKREAARKAAAEKRAEAAKAEAEAKAKADAEAARLLAVHAVSEVKVRINPFVADDDDAVSLPTGESAGISAEEAPVTFQPTPFDFRQVAQQVFMNHLMLAKPADVSNAAAISTSSSATQSTSAPSSITSSPPNGSIPVELPLSTLYAPGGNRLPPIQPVGVVAGSRFVEPSDHVLENDLIKRHFAKMARSKVKRLGKVNTVKHRVNDV